MPRQPRARVHRDARDLAVDQLALARVQAGADLEPEQAHRLDDRAGAPHGRPGRVERREEAVAGRIHLATAEPLELRTHERVVAGQQPRPAAVSQLHGALGRADDIGEEHRREHALAIVVAVVAGRLDDPAHVGREGVVRDVVVWGEGGHHGNDPMVVRPCPASGMSRATRP
jgi:hypothetical protein